MIATADADLQATLDALSSPVRREILWLVWRDELPVGDITAAVDLAAPTISGHLAALRRAGLVTMRSDGNLRRYRAEPERVAALLPLLAGEGGRWQAAEDLPERGYAHARTDRVVVASVDVPVSVAVAFRAFTDEAEYGRWLGVPVTLRDGRFACTLEWGTHVRGHYDVVAAPELIAMRWDFDDDAVPVPGRQSVAYLRFTGTEDGCRVEVHQHASDHVQADFFTAAWTMVLGRFATGHDTSSPPRPRRSKQRRPPRTPGSGGT